MQMSRFSKHVVDVCREFKPKWVLATGLAPIEFSVLREIGNLQIERLNYLTDDPWNPAHFAPWFMQTLACYDRVFSPRRANMESLSKHGCRVVSYLPFAYAPDVHFRGTDNFAGPHDHTSDVIFAGGADRDRVPVMTALIGAGFRVALYGGYWDRYKTTRDFHYGQVGAERLREVFRESKISLCLVRRANRDGHVMRSFEIPAMGGCMLTEDTEEHREMFGAEGETVLYFNSILEMLDKARWLLDHDKERARLAAAAHGRIINGRNTYQDRLEAILA